MIGKTNGEGGNEISSHNALLVVYTPLGSVVTINKDGISKTSRKDIALSDRPTVGMHLFSIGNSQFGTWTVAATSDDITQTKTITITAVEFYEIEVRVRVPDEYQEVEYLQANAGPYLDLEWQVDNDYLTSSEVDIKFSPTAFETTGRHIIGNWIGTTNSTYVRAFGMYVFRQDSKNKISYQIGGYDGEIFVQTNGVANTVYLTEMTIDNGTARVKCDTESGTLICDASKTITLINGRGTIPLFAARNDSEQVVTFAKARVYYLKVKKLGNFVKDLVPCYRISDSVAGMYDRVTKTFYTNQGSGTFTVGADV